MIPIDYLRARRRGDVVKPLYLHDEMPARLVLKAAGSCKTLDEFRNKVDGLGDRKLFRGLAHIAERFIKTEEVDARLVTRVRLEVFKASTGLALTPQEREKAFEAAAARLRLGVEAVKSLFLKAYEGNRAILRPPEITPGQLLKAYNLSLIQALLFKSLYVKTWVPNAPKAVKSLVRAVKGLRLMYIVEEREGGLEFQFDGPVSLFRQTERYGTRLAKLVPYIVALDVWKIEAVVKIGEKKYRFFENWRDAPPLPREPLDGGEFDSTVEREFYRQVGRVCPIEREPEVLVVDRRVYIPDFKIGDLYVEIVGFWTPDYLRRKYEKLAKVGHPMLILVNEELATATWRELMPNVVLFKERPRLSDVYKYIRPYCR
ncbi:MAG: DUF790 family protein [Pyrobaculum sp.]